MQRQRKIEAVVGGFMLLGLLAILILALKVSGLSSYAGRGSFAVTAVFDNIGGLKVRAPVTIAGVRMGEVTEIAIDPTTFKAYVKLGLDRRQSHLPGDTTAKILTAGIVGANYVELVPGYSENNLQDGAQIVDTQPAIVLEELIGKLIYKLSGGQRAS